MFGISKEFLTGCSDGGSWDTMVGGGAKKGLILTSFMGYDTLKHTVLR